MSRTLMRDLGLGHIPLKRDLELERLVSLAEASDLTGLSIDSLRRHYSHLIRRLSPRRLGIKLRDALGIGAIETDAS